MAKKNNNFGGRGRKRPQDDKSVNVLHLDPENPRLSPEVQGGNEEEIAYALYKYFDTEEVAYSLAKNGYFDEEPVVVFPKELPNELKKISPDALEANQKYLDYILKDDTHFIVAEGNRRLATIKILLDAELRAKFKIKNYPELSPEIKEDISTIPVIIYPNRNLVVPYLGVRHITGGMKWDPYPKARYISGLIKGGTPIEEVQNIVGDRSNSIKKFYLCYQLILQVHEELGVDVKQAASDFSYLLLATSQGAIKEYIGLPTKIADTNFDSPTPKKKLDNLKNLFSWLYGEGTKIPRVIKESRDITNYLSPILKNESATKYLKATRDLVASYDRSGGEEQLLITYLIKAKQNIDKAMPLISKYQESGDVKDEVDSIEDAFKTLKVILKNS